jgi:hypothetical protein
MQNTFGVADYFSYMAVGMISMIVMTTTMFSGMSIVWDRRLGFLGQSVKHSSATRSNNIFKSSQRNLEGNVPSDNNLGTRIHSGTAVKLNLHIA